MQNAIAFADNDVALVAWSYGAKVAGCMGFAVYRIDSTGKETPLPSMAVFPGFTPKKGQTTERFPIQKFYWKDPYARLVADRTGSRRFRYKIVPLAGKPGSLKPMSVAFLISTQRVSSALGGHPAKASLLAAIAQKGHALRASLAGDMVPALLDSSPAPSLVARSTPPSTSSVTTS
jgi:hypothetical protein